jgi:hypothetical protein
MADHWTVKELHVGQRDLGLCRVLNNGGKTMMKTFYKNLVWMVLPLGLVVGCAENRPVSEASYGPPPNVVLQPTSREPEQRIYRETDSAVTAPNVTVNTAPAGASAETWAVAEEIRQKLMSDTTLAPMGSTLIANVSKDGVVTLRGNVSSPSEQQRVCDSISSLPGVRSIDNQLSFGSYRSSGTLNTQ